MAIDLRTFTYIDILQPQLAGFFQTVAPGFVETDMAVEILAGPEGDAIRAQSPLNRVARPEEVARAVLMLAREGNEYMTGCILDVNGASYLRS